MKKLFSTILILGLLWCSVSYSNPNNPTNEWLADKTVNQLTQEYIYMAKMNDSKNIKAQAQHWVSRIEQGLSKEERQAFVAWVNHDKQHHLAFTNLSP